jgi:hypothetical protein
MMHVRLIRLDSPEASLSFDHSLFAYQVSYRSEKAFNLYIGIERNLRSGKETNRNVWFSD